jgi:hypothetical protein
MQNWSQTILSQYASSPTINGIIGSANSAIDPTADIANIYSYLWNVNTAVGQGLNNWGQIVGVGRTLQIPTTPSYFGFHEAGASALPFGQAPMYAGPLATQTYALGDSDYRTLILAKAAANISPLTAPSVNAILTSIYGGLGRVYCQDTGAMSQRYVFEFQPSAVQLAIVVSGKVIPRSAGVKATALVYQASSTFGFFEASGQPFGSGTLFPTTGLVNAA